MSRDQSGILLSPFLSHSYEAPFLKDNKESNISFLEAVSGSNEGSSISSGEELARYFWSPEEEMMSSNNIKMKSERIIPATQEQLVKIHDTGKIVKPLNQGPFIRNNVTPKVDVKTICELLKEQDVKKKRLARKAELARLSRKRKKKMLNDLEEQVSTAKKELDEERKKRKILEEKLNTMSKLFNSSEFEPPTTSVDDVHKKTDEDLEIHHHSLETLVGKPSNNVEIEGHVSQIASLLKKRNNESSTLVKKMKTSVLPNTTVRFFEWMMNQNEKFYNDKTGLWNTLVHKELGLSKDQVEKLLNLRESMAQQKEISNMIESQFENLSNAMDQFVPLAAKNIDDFSSCITHEQMSKFLIWVKTYGSICVKINL